MAQNNLVVGGPGSGISTGPTGTQVAANLTMATPPWAATAPTRLRDYRPDAARSSALIDQGVALAEATTDAQRIAGLTDGDGDGLREWDIGAFEIGGSTSPPPPPPSAPAAPVLLP